MSAKIKSVLSVFSGVPFALLYGALARFVFSGSGNSNLFTTLSIAFLLLVPIALGALTVWFAPADQRANSAYAFFAPWVTCVIAAGIAGLFFIEYWICVVMALPILCVMASVGGIMMRYILVKRRQSNSPLIGLIVLTPFLFAPVEHQFPVVDSYQTVHTQIEVAADEATIWQNITRVSRIQEAERPFSLIFDLFGAPKPLEATLTNDGTGAMRRGIFTGGLFFNERITRWDAYRRLDFEITAENTIAPDTKASLAPWSEIGGAYFAVPNASYRLEPMGNGHVLLQLDSTYRLTTRFNGYGVLWASWGMSEFQNQILQIVKARAEAGR